ncbi:Sodium, potassium, lithium and rubidium/H(+) antiporter [Planococcus massiliensis]|uniref:Sodium, potassium, lithium and rubidium/H(+) antiporter n=1 Tax=Planococcus massiliensis TaxID=1499687 RepID=A0A098ENF1_9BACL|nr:Na+/H+ antiporter [Planococcus massiliensis]CEG22826.1 Sodium, potassium, lithium and rubidium/H(+) antiporter [Planococcus massiliensis]
MDILMTILLLLVALLISNVISHYTPFIPTALIQIALGVLLVLFFEDISFDIDTEWFLLLFIAPLLYNDGRHFPREELWRMRGPILGNAIILVLLTTVLGGYFIHWMIAAIPLYAAFALAAILSPTDPVAVNGIAKRIHIPDKVLNLVRGESLINDASGLVAFNYAVAAVVTGYFSIQEAVFDFSYKFVMGGVLGIVLGLLVIWIRHLLRKQGINDVTFQSLLHIMTPFFIFIVTEELLHASGVISVVVAGIIHSLVRERTETLVAEEQMLAENIWTIILFVLNGIVFLLLGLNIPSSMSGVLENPDIGYLLLFSYVIGIGVFIFGVRFIWSYLFASFEARFTKSDQVEKPSFKQTLLTSLTGVRGTVTMVGVLSIPYALESGEDFPNRSLIIFLAAGTILFTLLAATILLPLLSRGETVEGQVVGKIDTEEARKRLLLASIKKLKAETTEENETVAYELIEEYKLRLKQILPEEELRSDENKQRRKQLKKIRMKALSIEKSHVEMRLKEKRFGDEKIRKAFAKSFRRREAAIEKNVHSLNVYIQSKLIRAWRRFKGEYLKDDETRLVNIQLGKEVQLEALEKAMDYLQRLSNEGEKQMASSVMHDYRRMIKGLETPESHFNEQYEIQKEELRLIIMDMGRSKIYKMYEDGEISREQAKELRRYLNHIESITLYEYSE